MTSATLAGDAMPLSEQNGSDVRSIFVSDVHLGCKHARAERFLTFLHAYQPENLYLVGDIIDGWRLRRLWHWTATYDAILQRLVAMADSGTNVLYTPGNHDNFLRTFPLQMGGITIADEFVHETAHGHRYLVTHGDKFDRFEQGAQWISVVATFAYEIMLYGNRMLSFVRGRKGDFSLCASLKSKAKWLVRFFSDFEKTLGEHASANDCHGVICGHIHRPNRLDVDDVTYFNTGDWIEHSTALIEYNCGTMQLVEYDGIDCRPIATIPAEAIPQTAQAGETLRPRNELAEEEVTPLGSVAVAEPALAN
ncbi:UDP-2,3-diacylglucosamine diphosphatase [Stratiformator vulcanicus]|uniref:UDP-2,3-diacylglucosamine hydrolase n=1 Tax=Stratiformator vulcanicus TaxID=2527980 RepID=A0A517R641_9PLAN|nr:UDP-2,3-diacylglucosamine diphosphatase [Stratiformator vulcanicus]QDT39364.1 UDP-2,3-diacylglucosamine hydrolase [Stratiformator vulcanicus]